MYYLKSGRTITELIEIDNSNSKGNLRKWVANVNGNRVYIKSSSISRGIAWYECESECIVSRIGSLMGIQNVIMYHLDYLIIDTEVIKVCYSTDFVNKSYFLLYADLIPNINKFHGIDKYNQIIGYKPELEIDINNMLMMDALMYNEDRHLRNMGILSNGVSFFLPYFDNGNSLFYNKSINEIKNEMRVDWKFQKCKPFYSTIGNQLELIGSNYKLKKIKKTSIYKIVNSYLSGERAKLVNRFLVESIRRAGLIEEI